MKGLKKIINEELGNFILNETNFNFHFGELDPSKKYWSDNKFQMRGRETGHFGSGTYFSTYESAFDRKDMYDYKNYDKENPNLIQVGNKVYRVDFDLYKNLYRVESKKEGDLLYSALTNLNIFFNLNNYRDYERLPMLYQKIKINCQALGLNCPSMRELVNMARFHENSGELKSFSTYFMEYNGFNGVNVSGISFYDNTKHGSVVYDLSKINANEIKLNKKISYVTDETPYNDTLATSDFMGGAQDPYISSLSGNINFFNMDNLLKLNFKDQLRCLKNTTINGKVLNYSDILKLNDDLIKRYMRYVFFKKPNNMASTFDENVKYNSLLDVACEKKLYYWINYVSQDGKISGLIKFLSEFDDEIMFKYDDDIEGNNKKKEYLKLLLKYLKRDLNENEKKYIYEYYIN